MVGKGNRGCWLIQCFVVLFDAFLSLFRQAALGRKQTLLVLNQLLLGTELEAADVEALANDYLDELFCHWDISTQLEPVPAVAPESTSLTLLVTQQPGAHLTLAAAQERVGLACLLVEGVATCAQVRSA